MKALQRPGRTAAVVGAVVAVSATTLMGFAGTALARVPGTCTETVNVRAEPSIDSRIVAVCEAGTAVETGATRDGFVRLMDLGGWASAQYVSVDGAAPASTGPSTATRPATSPSTPPSTRPSTRPAPAEEEEETGGSGDELSQRPAGTDPSSGGSGTSDESPGRNSFTPDESDATDTEPAGSSGGDAEERSPGLGGGLL